MKSSSSTSKVGVGYSPPVFSPTEQFDPLRVKSRHYIQTGVFIFCSVLFCWAYFAFILLALQYQNGYTNVGNAPPGIWNSSRYNWQWWAAYLLNFNILLPWLFAMALANNTMAEYAKLHYFIARLSFVLNFISFLILSFSWLFACNYSWSAFDSSCNDVRYCCVYFAENPGWCSNFGFCNPNVSSTQLLRSGPFFGAWLFSMLFFLWGLGHRSMNRDMRVNGLFQAH